MKPILLALAAIALAPSARGADVQKFTRTSLVYFLEGPGDFAQPWMKDRCDESDQARVKQAAEEAAKADCEKAQGTKDCLVKFSRVTVNGPLDASTLSKYGLQQNGDGYGYWGCEGEALVYGLSD